MHLAVAAALVEFLLVDQAVVHHIGTAVHLNLQAPVQPGKTDEVERRRSGRVQELIGRSRLQRNGPRPEQALVFDLGQGAHTLARTVVEAASEKASLIFRRGRARLALHYYIDGVVLEVRGGRGGE